MGDGLRLDKFLWFVRLAKTRSAAQALAATGHLRLDGRRVERAHACVRVGSVLSLPTPAGARVVRVEALPLRRGPAPEARACYTPLGENGREEALTTRAGGD
ncbi:MAG TPA: S4 domain-containing protein [Sphingomonadaceae bacterium]|nr:S4 domain-containing protein [Sphingomonadaceae bacterium]